MALAIASAKVNLPTVPHLVAIGEVGLTGEVRRVGAVPQRLAEAARLGFTVALVPIGCAPAKGTAPTGMKIREVADLPEALRLSALLAVDAR
jgi:DNA repair protein RadA/Sms